MSFYENKIFARGLLVECPMGHPLEDCPLSELRILSISVRMKYVDKLSEEKVEELVTHHKKCLAKREGKTN